MLTVPPQRILLAQCSAAESPDHLSRSLVLNTNRQYCFEVTVGSVASQYATLPEAEVAYAGGHDAVREYRMLPHAVAEYGSTMRARHGL